VGVHSKSSPVFEWWDLRASMQLKGGGAQDQRGKSHKKAPTANESAEEKGQMERRKSSNASSCGDPKAEAR